MSDWEAGRIGYYVPPSDHSAGHIEHYYPSLAVQGMASHGFPPNKIRCDEAERMAKAISGGPGYFTYPTLGGLSNEAIGKLSPREIAELVKLLPWTIDLPATGDMVGKPLAEFASLVERYTLKPRSLASRMARWIGRGMGMC